MAELWEYESMYRKVLDDLIKDVTHIDDLVNDKRRLALFNQISTKLEGLGTAVRDWIPYTIGQQYVDGYGIAGEQLWDLTGSKPAVNIKAKAHLKAIDEIVNDTFYDLRSAIRTAERESISGIITTLERVQSKIGVGIGTGDTVESITKMVQMQFVERGFTGFITRDGRRLPLDFYSMTVVRTKMKDANVKGAIARYIENGVDLVQTTEVGSTCPICAKREGIIVSLSGKDKDFPSVEVLGGLPPWHPNCIHSVRPYMKQFKSKEDIQQDKERNEDRVMLDNRTPAQKKEYNTGQQIRAKANQEKKKYYEMRAVLGDDAPSSLAQYRRMSRANNPSWQKLQKEYKLAVNEIREDLATKVFSYTPKTYKLHKPKPPKGSGGGESGGGTVARKEIDFDNVDTTQFKDWGYDKEGSNKWAVDNYDKWLKGLSEQERAALYDYTDSLYQPLNRHFYNGGTIDDLSGWLKSSATQMDKALSRAVISRDTVLYRGVDCPYLMKLFDKFSDNPKKMVGLPYTPNAYISTSVNATGYFSGKEVTVKIYAKQGDKGGYLNTFSKFGGEDEILLPRNTTMKILDAYYEGGQKTVEAIIVSQPY